MCRLSVLGWQCGLASLAFIDGTVIQGLIVLNSSTYVFERWCVNTPSSTWCAFISHVLASQDP
jgi:hypothetical protein